MARAYMISKMRSPSMRLASKPVASRPVTIMESDLVRPRPSALPARYWSGGPLRVKNCDFTSVRQCQKSAAANNGHSLRFALAMWQLALGLREKHNFISPKDDRKRGSSGKKQSQ